MKYYFNKEKIVLFTQFKMMLNQSALDLNRGLSSNFWWLRDANHVRFTDECALCTEKHVLVTQIFTNELSMELPCWNWVEKKTANGVETFRLTSKEKFPFAASSKEGLANSILGHEMTHLYWYLWKEQK